MTPVKLIAVFAQNLPGQSARVAKILADAGVNVHWTSIANSGSFGVMKFLVGGRDYAEKILRSAGLMVNTLEVVAVDTDNRAGSLHAVVDALAREGLNLDNVSGFVTNQRAVILVETQIPERARAILAAQGFHLLSEEELLSV